MSTKSWPGDFSPTPNTTRIELSFDPLIDPNATSDRGGGETGYPILDIVDPMVGPGAIEVGADNAPGMGDDAAPIRVGAEMN